jgi:hypothetical protein
MNDLTFTIGHEELVIRQRWEVVSIINDILVAVWFIAGSILFFQESTTVVGTWFFLLGSIELLIRPVIRLARRVHLKRIGRARTASESDDDF